MHDLTAFQRDLLYVIAGLDEPPGLRIRDELEHYYNAEVNRGWLYPNLDTLTDKGLVQKDEVNHRTNKYTLADRGQQEIADRREWETEYYAHDTDLEGD